LSFVLDAKQFKIITGAGREVLPNHVEQYNIIQDNRSKTVTVAKYEHRQLGPREMYFLNGNEAIINGRGRYVLTKSASVQGAVIIDLSKVKDEESSTAE
jgi:hypothetical protein